ncbi:MAG: YggS family pyridoxal phosphate-dependent enzyme [Nitrospinae bacterium]|nr:YggS family pyridoxal phosphate-dependent enzyme [Nitrospinota bacterium]
MSDITINIKEIRNRIGEAANRVGRNPLSVKLVAATKTVAVSSINEAIEAGIDIIGENRIQEARDKAPELNKVSCHLIGHLQKNKVKYIFGLFDMVHSVDSPELAAEINRQAIAKGKRMDILLQVNVSGEESKFGFDEKNLLPDLSEIGKMEGIAVKGLMTIPPYSDEPNDSRPFFKRLSALRKKIQAMGIEGIEMGELSMGMSNDFEVAVEEGATMVRVGSAIFGRRQ